MILHMNTSLLLCALLISSANCEWSWGKKIKNEAETPTEVKIEQRSVPNVVFTSSQDLYNNPSQISNEPSQVPSIANLPLEGQSVIKSEHIEEHFEDNEGRAGRFLGISNRLCKMGFKGVCNKPGYPPKPPQYISQAGSSSYNNYVQIPNFSQSSSINQYMSPPKAPKKVFNFKNKNTRVQHNFIPPKNHYNAPTKYKIQQVNNYVPPRPAANYGPPLQSVNNYVPPKIPVNNYGPPRQPPVPHYEALIPSYKAPKPKRQHINPNFILPNPIHDVNKPIHNFSAPKPSDILSKQKGQHSFPTHLVAAITPTKVQHLHSHTHIYNDISPLNVKTIEENNFQAASQLHGVAKDLGDSFKPSLPAPYFDDFSSNQDKRHITKPKDSFNDFNAFKKQKTFQQSIDELTSSFAKNGLQNYYADDCQCVLSQYCSDDNLVARSDPRNIGHLLDARNEQSDILSDDTLPDNFYEYDYIKDVETSSNRKAKVLDVLSDITNETFTNNTFGNTTTPAINTTDLTTKTTTTIELTTTPKTTVSTSTSTIPSTTVSGEDSKRVRRETTEEKNINSTFGLEGRQLTGFAPGLNGCGAGHVCCQRPVYQQARSQPICGKGNPSIHGRVSTFEYQEGLSDFGEYPWQAAILREQDEESMFVCGATLIDAQHVLTAAHCVNDLNVQNLKVRLGEWDVNRETEFYSHIEVRVAAMFIHQDFYKGNLYNDIAVVKLAQYVDLNDNPHISPICLPPPQTDFTGFNCHVTGWGKNAFGDNGKFQHILKELQIGVVDHKSCENALRNTRLGRDYKLHEGFLCAGGEEGKDACKGDGGGPLVCSARGSKTSVLAGVVSWGVGCGLKGVPGVYVNIPYYVDWIRNVLGF